MLRNAAAGACGALARGWRGGLGSTASVLGSQATWLHSTSSAGRELELPPVPKAKGATVVLMTGGLESAALLSYYAHWSHGHTLYPLYVQLGRRCETQELRAAQRLCRHLGLELSMLNAEMLGTELRWTQKKDRRRIIPHRNLVLLSLAASHAVGVSDGAATHLAMCTTQDDLNTYSTSSSSFLQHMDALLATLDPPLQLLAPLARLSRWQVVKLGEQVSAPWKHTYVCEQGEEKHCGKCRRCELRKEVFHRAGIEEPWGTYAA